MDDQMNTGMPVADEAKCEHCGMTGGQHADDCPDKDKESAPEAPAASGDMAASGSEDAGETPAAQ